MPTYQYACTDQACANRFDLVQSFTEPSATTCPVCAAPVRKVYGSVGVVFKGSGFYRNDSRAAANGGKNESASSDGESANTSTKTESKPSSESPGSSTPSESTSSSPSSTKSSKSSNSASSDSSSPKSPVKSSA